MTVIEQYALNEAAFVIVRFLQRYDKIKCVDVNKPIKKKMTLILSPGDGENIRLHRATL
jgi:hypothetical protein